jgi:hypothetical protein
MFHTPEDRFRAKMRIIKARSVAAKKANEALIESKKRSHGHKVRQRLILVAQKKHKVKKK